MTTTSRIQEDQTLELLEALEEVPGDQEDLDLPHLHLHLQTHQLGEDQSEVISLMTNPQPGYKPYSNTYPLGK